MAKITINGVAVEVADGTSVIAAADQAGLFIPRFCYHPDLHPAGNCRICQVEIEGSPRLAIACMTPVKDGMVVRSDSDKVKKAVQGDLEFLLANHPVDCPICDQAGECYLQDYYMQVGQHDSRVPLTEKVRKRKVIDLGPMIVLDRERCVLCSRCVRFGDEVSKRSQFGFFHRGTHMEIGTFRDRPVDDPYSGCYADVCPVGALTSNDFRFRSRVWFLNRTESICPECSTGCNIRIDHKDGEAHRFLPRRNPEVNRSWMCDVGRLSYREVKGPDRLLGPQLGASGGRSEVSWERMTGEVAAVIADVARGSGAAAFIATPRATCEELWLFRRLARECAASPHLDYRVDPACDRVAEREDEVLRRQDHNPNTRGASALGVVPGEGGAGVAGILERAARGELKLLYLLGPELLTRWPDRELVKRALKGAAFVVLHDTHRRPEHDLVHALLPRAAFAESEGTFVNFDHRLQRLNRAFPPPGQARPAADVLASLIDALGHGPAPRGARAVLREIAGAVPAFAGTGFDRCGPLGMRLATGIPGTAAPSSIATPSPARI
jgi:NADH-quinone oxidoreductase subunit G